MRRWQQAGVCLGGGTAVVTGVLLFHALSPPRPHVPSNHRIQQHAQASARQEPLPAPVAAPQTTGSTQLPLARTAAVTTPPAQSSSTHWLRGVVLASTGQPVEQFEVQLFPRYLPIAPAAHAAAFADPRGEFELSWDQAGPVDVVVKAKGFMQGLLPQVTLAPSREDADWLEIRLTPAGTIRGVVRTRDGTPIPKAVVQLGQYLYSLHVGQLPDGVADTPEVREAIGQALQEEFKRSNPNPWTETDEQGQFVLTDLPQGTYPLTASHPEYLPATTSVTLRPGLALAHVELVLGDRSSDTGTIVVTTTDGSDQPVADIPIRLEGHQVKQEGRTDAQGVLRIADVPSGKYQITATADVEGGGPTTRWASVFLAPQQEAHVTLAFQSGATVLGTVDRDGQPVADLSVVVTQVATQRHMHHEKPPSPNDPIEGHAEAATTTDSQGHFEAHHLPPGSYQLTVIEPSGRQTSVGLVLNPAERQRSFLIHLATATLSGTVRTAEGRPIVSAMVEATHLGSLDGEEQADVLSATAPCQATTDEQGRYRCAGLALGRYLLYVHAASYGRTQQPVDLALADTQHEVVLQPAGQLVVTVTSRNRLPLPGAYVLISKDGKSENALAALTDEYGIAQWPNLEPGAYDVSVGQHSAADPDASIPPSMPIVISPGGVARISLTAELLAH